MNISDSFLKAQLRNVFWIGGAAYGGKTTVTDLLAHRHGFQPYHPEDLFHEHKQAASPEDHPALFAPFHGWEWFFNRPLEDYIKAIEENFREQIEMVILDLVKLNADSKVVVEGCLLNPWLVNRLTEHKKSLFLYANETTIKNGFFAREDKHDMLDVINTLSDPIKTREHVLEVTCAASARARAEAEAAGVKVLVRSAETELQETMTKVEQHFGLA